MEISAVVHTFAFENSFPLGIFSDPPWGGVGMDIPLGGEGGLVFLWNHSMI